MRLIERRKYSPRRPHAAR